jgi:sugar lactone lactonase YvrE
MKRFRARVAARAVARQAASGGAAVVTDVWLNAVAVVTTLAGSGSFAFANGTGTGASFAYPFGVAVLSNGNIVVGDQHNHRIRIVTPAGVVTTLAGSSIGYADGTGTGANFTYPSGVAILPNGNIVVADLGNHRIRIVTPAGVVTTLAGSGSPAFADGTGTLASFNSPHGVSVLPNGNVIVGDSSNNRIRLVTPAGVVTTLAGSGSPAFADGTGALASFNSPRQSIVLSNGNIVMVDTGNHRIRLVTQAGVVTTLAGSGTPAFANGTGTGASFSDPNGVDVLPNGNIVVGDWSNHRIRLITPAGVVTTLAGNGTGTSVDGTGAGASFINPIGVAVNPSNGAIVVAEFGGNLIRLLTPTALPLTIPGCALWLDGADGSTLFSDSSGTTRATVSGTVGFWKDKSPSATGVSNATAGQRPTYTANGLLYAGAQELVGTPPTLSGGGFAAFVVYNPTTPSTRTAPVYIWNGYYRVGFETTTNNFGNPSLSKYQPVSPIAGATNIMSLVAYSATQLEWTVNLATSSTTWFADDSMGFGNQYGIGSRGGLVLPFVGTISEVILYNGFLTVTQKQVIEGYLAWKWGLQASLPVGHPYKSAAPT